MTQEYRSEKLENVLRTLHLAVRDIKASVIVNADGLLVASFPPAGPAEDEALTNSPQVAAMAATLLGLAENTLDRLAQGKLGRILMEGEEGLMMVYPAGHVAAVAVLMQKDVLLERAFFATEKAAEQILAVLSTQ